MRTGEGRRKDPQSRKILNTPLSPIPLQKKKKWTYVMIELDRFKDTYKRQFWSDRHGRENDSRNRLMDGQDVGGEKNNDKINKKIGVKEE